MDRFATACLSLAFAAALVGGCFSTAQPSATPLPTGEPPPERRPIIIDTDFDHSDIAAILVLLRDPKVDVRAITVAGTGLVHCRGGRLVARYLLDELGVPDIPFGCGREDGGADARPFPDDWRARADAGYGLDITPKVEAGVPRDAADLLREAVDGSPSAPTIVALGPLTNLEDAFAADPTLPDRIALVHAMLGTVDAPGNVFVDAHDGTDPLEWNAFADPSAVEAVFATDVPIDIVPLDATDDVPVPADLTQRLAEDHAAGGADLMYELLLRNPSRLDGSQGQQLWDELAALALGEQDLVTWSDADLLVGEGGRLTADAAGRPVRYASAADASAVEAALLTALRRGGPRVTPFGVGGTVDVASEDTTSAAATEGAPEAEIQVAFIDPPWGGGRGHVPTAARLGAPDDHSGQVRPGARRAVHAVTTGDTKVGVGGGSVHQVTASSVRHGTGCPVCGRIGHPMHQPT